MKKAVCPVLFAAAFAVVPAHAQGPAAETRSNLPGDPYAWALFSYEAETELDPSAWGGAGKPKAQMGEFDSALSVPVFQNNDFILALGALFTWNGLRFKDLPDVKDYDLYAAGMPVDVVYSGLSRAAFWFNVTPGLFTDFTKLSGDDYRTLAHAMMLYEMMPDLQLGLGFSYDREFGEDQLYPLGGVIWTLSKEWRLKLLLPSPGVVYAPSDRLLFFADARPAGNKWNIEAEENKEADFKLECWRVGGGMEFRLFGPLWLHAAGGVVLDRKYEIHDGDKTVLESKVDDAFFARAGLVLQ